MLVNLLIDLLQLLAMSAIIGVSIVLFTAIVVFTIVIVRAIFSGAFKNWHGGDDDDN